MTGLVAWPDVGQVGQMLTLQQVACELTITPGQVLGLIRTGDLSAVLSVGQNPRQGGWWVERAELEVHIQRAYRRTAQSLASMPIDPPDELTCSWGRGKLDHRASGPAGVRPRRACSSRSVRLVSHLPSGATERPCRWRQVDQRHE